MSTRSEGRRIELKCKEELEKRGWLVHLVKMPQKFSKSQDLFGIFDIFAVHKEEHISLKLFVQVKKNDRYRKRTLDSLKEFKDEYLDEYDMVQLWDWKKRKRKNPKFEVHIVD